jgi:hypothetical protein
VADRASWPGPRMRLFHSGPGPQAVLRVRPASMREPLSRPEEDEHGTSEMSIRRRPRLRSATRHYVVAPFTPQGPHCAMSDRFAPVGTLLPCDVVSSACRGTSGLRDGDWSTTGHIARRIAAYWRVLEHWRWVLPIRCQTRSGPRGSWTSWDGTRTRPKTVLADGAGEQRRRAARPGPGPVPSPVAPVAVGVRGPPARGIRANFCAA